MQKQFTSIDKVIHQYDGLSRKVLEYSKLVGDMVQQAKQPGFSADSWAPFAAMMDTQNFKRIGNFKEVMDWEGYLGFLNNWAPNAEWECSFKRITEHDGVVYLELEERSTVGEYKNSVNSLSVYAFNEQEKISHIDVYLQMELPPAEMLQSYDGVI